MNLTKLMELLWADYVKLNPEALKIHAAFTARGEFVQNDHVALRTIRHAKLGIDQMAKPFENFGYQKKNHYFFQEKKLSAYHYEHEDEQLPKIFISELMLDAFSPFCQSTLNRLIDSIPENEFTREDFSLIGRPWRLTSSEYLKLANESEYASWVAAYGFRANHFTVLVNSLKTFSSLAEVNPFVKSLGFAMNASGGEIKGSRSEFLEQSSTLAEKVEVTFSDQTILVPACYYEFAERYSMPNGKLYSGFVAASADKIFESTDRQE